MASITLKSVSDRFPVGTSLGAYPDVGWLETHPPPFSAATATGTVLADGSVTFANVSPSLAYRAGADMGGGIWRYIGFYVPPPQSSGQSLEPAPADAVQWVSSTNGNDANDGRSEGSAKATIQAAINALPAGVTGRVRFLPGSTHVISASVTLRSDLILDFNNALIQRQPGLVADLFNSPAAISRVMIQDGRFDNSLSSQFGFDFTNGSSEITFRNNRITGHNSTFLNFAIGVNFNSNIRIVGNSFYGDPLQENQNVIVCNSPNDFYIVDNYLEGTGGIQGSVSSSQSGTCRQIVIRGNVFKNLRASAIGLRLNGNSVIEDVMVIENAAYSLGDNLHVKGHITVGEQIGSTGPGTCRRVMIANNTVRDYYGSAITLGGGPTDAICEDYAVVGNMCDSAPVDQPVDPARGSEGISVHKVSRFSILGNTVRNTGRGGIRILDGSYFGSIVGNHIDGCVANPNLTLPPASEEAGIQIFDGHDIAIMGNTVRNSSTAQGGVAGIAGSNLPGITGIRVIGNRCFDDRTPMLQEFGVRIGDSVGSDATQPQEWMVTDNDFRGNLTAAIKTYNTTAKNYVFHHNKDITGVLAPPAGIDPLRRSAFTTSTTLTITVQLAAITDNTASRTVTLPLISAVALGHSIIVKDETGSAATRAITVAAQGTDTIEAAASKQITTNYGSLRLYSNGTQWMAL